jgi:hypothetical protein
MTEERPTEPTPAPDEIEPTPPPVAPSPAEPPASAPPVYTPPPAATQPAVAWAPPPAAVATGRRSSLSLAAGILLVVLGALGGLLSLLILTIGREVVRQLDFTNLPGVDTGGADVGAIAGGAVTFVGILLLAFSLFYILGGVGVIRSASWGRVIGIIVGVLAGLFWLGSVGNGGRGDGVGFALILLAIHAYVAIALIFFWRDRAPA